MKRTAVDHPKIRQFARILGVPRYSAVGILELLWHFTARHSIRGDIGKWADEVICEAIDWPTERAAELIEKLLQCRLLDKHRDHRLVVHDWHDHADESTKKTLAKHKMSFASLEEGTEKLPPRKVLEITRQDGFLERSRTIPERSVIESDSLSHSLSHSQKSSRQKLRFSEDDMAVASWMWEQIQQLASGQKPPNLNSWANVIRLMRECDNRTHAQIRVVFEWAHRDGFWATNILSPQKLRRQFDSLLVKSSAQPNTENGHAARNESPARVHERDVSEYL